jgi:hypothetical protein
MLGGYHDAIPLGPVTSQWDYLSICLGGLMVHLSRRTSPVALLWLSRCFGHFVKRNGVVRVTKNQPSWPRLPDLK